MFRSHLKMAGRHVLKSKAFSLIHVLGLSVGIIAFLLITYYVGFQLSFDRFYDGHEKIYRVAVERVGDDNTKSASAKNFTGIPSLIKTHFPEVEACTGFDRTATNAYFLFRYQGKRYYEQEAFYQTDSSFFRVFPALLKAGNPAVVLRGPHSLVISEKIARKVFGNEDPIGKRIENGSFSYSDVSEFVITGVMTDMPRNAHLHINFIAPNSHLDEVAPAAFWQGPKMYTYIRLGAHADAGQIAERLNTLIEKLEPEHPRMKGAKVFLQPVSDIHLRSHLLDELEANGNENLVYGLSVIGVIILVLAWINYVNIEAARFITKARTVVIRRIVGSSKAHLALQFLLEYALIACTAGIIATGFLWLATGHLHNLMDLPEQNFPAMSIGILLKASGLFVAGSIITGVYPAVFLSRMNLAESLKGNTGGTKNGITLRRFLMTVQFSSALFLTVFVCVIYSQLDYMRQTNKKVDLEKIISIRNPSVYTNDDDSVNYAEFETLKNILLQDHRVTGATSASVIPGEAIEEYLTDRLKVNLTAPFDPTRYRLLFVDDDFVPFYDLKLKAGRNYSTALGDDEDWNRIILNESAIHALGFASAKEAVDQEIHFHLWGDKFEKYKIVGIVADYHHESVKKKVEPTVLVLNHSRFQQVFYAVKFSAESNPHEALAYVEKCWKQVFPDKPFEYYFQDDFYDQQFKSELRFGRILGVFSGVAIFIACLGIAGMTLYEANSRLKEISIRKVLGATMSSLLLLLSKEYVKVVFAASFMAMPFAYYYASRWLMSYPARIDVRLWFFLLPLSGMVLLIAAVSGLLASAVARGRALDHLKHE